MAVPTISQEIKRHRDAGQSVWTLARSGKRWNIWELNALGTCAGLRTELFADSAEEALIEAKKLVTGVTFKKFNRTDGAIVFVGGRKAS